MYNFPFLLHLVHCFLIQLLLQEPEVVGAGAGGTPEVLRCVNAAVLRQPLARTLLHRLKIQFPLVKESNRRALHRRRRGWRWCRILPIPHRKTTEIIVAIRQLRHGGALCPVGGASTGAGILRRVTRSDLWSTNEITPVHQRRRHWSVRSVAVDGGCPGGGLNPFDEPRYPEISHGVLELLAVNVAFQLFSVLLNSSPPVVLYLVICSSR